MREVRVICAIIKSVVLSTVTWSITFEWLRYQKLICVSLYEEETPQLEVLSADGAD